MEKKYVRGLRGPLWWSVLLEKRSVSSDPQTGAWCVFLGEFSFTKLNEFESFGRFQRILKLKNRLRYVLDILLSLDILQ